jgi:hypothetical protein
MLLRNSDHKFIMAFSWLYVTHGHVWALVSGNGLNFLNCAAGTRHVPA